MPTLSGIVRYAGAPFEGATVVAVNQSTDTAYDTESAADGTYSLDVPAGTYEVTAFGRLGSEFLRGPGRPFVEVA